jgi:hypothetical protein
MNIKLGNKTYQPGKQKAKFWRKLAEFDDNKKDIPYNDFVDSHAEMIAKAFANPEVTAEKILDNYDIDEIIPLFRDISSWFFGQLYAKLNKIPNEQTTAE